MLQIARMVAPEGDAAWLANDDVLDDEEPPTLRVPHYASVAVGEVVNDPPRRRSRLLLRVLLVSCAVAIVFELGWCGGSRLLPGSETSQAASQAPMRILLHKAPRTLAPPEEP